ncbi:MAG: formyl transferase [Acidobacteria bacterium]|nr:formyl transferase [Acidobacteriota bacterium]
MSEVRCVFLTGSDQSPVLASLVGDGTAVAALILPWRSRNEARLAPVIGAAERLGIEVLRPRRAELAAALRRIAPDLLVSYGYPYLVAADALRIPAHAINVHPSLLPRYRGPNVEWHIIASGDVESGVTVHLMDEGMDTGPIVYRQPIALSPFETIRSYARKVEDAVPVALRAAIRLLGTPGFAPVPQDEAHATRFPRFRTPDDSRIDPTRPLLELFHQIKACDPERFPAFFEYEGERVGVKLFRLNRPAGAGDEI